MTLGDPRKSLAVVAALLAIGIGVAYSNSFGIGFYFDDSYGISDNPAIRSLQNIPSFFIDPYGNPKDNTQVDVRPFVFVTYALNYAVSELRPWSYHALNLLLHFAAAVLVFVIVRDHVWTPPDEGGGAAARVPAAAAALFFALAPLNSQPVDYMWARSALLCTTFYLAAFLAFVRRRWTLGSVLFVLALLAKAIAVTLPAVVLVHAFLYRDRAREGTALDFVRGWRQLVLPVGVPIVIDAAYLGYRSAVLPPWGAGALHAAWVTPWIWCMSQWSALLYYVRLFVWPDGLSADHDFPYTTRLLSVHAWLPLLVLLAWIALALRAARRYPQVTFATLWYFVTLAPESSFAPLAEVVNDHRPYLASSLGLSVLLAWLLDRASAVAGAHRRTVFVAASLLLCVAAIPVIRHRNWEWQDGLRLWESTVRSSPGNTRAWMNAGQEHMARGHYAEARRYFNRARELSPDYAFVHMNLSVLETHDGHPDIALREAEEAVRNRPDMSRSHFFLGRALEKLGLNVEAAAAYQHAFDLNPRDPEIQTSLARVRGKRDDDQSLMASGLYALRTSKDPERAAAIFRQVLEHTPTHYGATYQLAVALDAAGRPVEARPLWQKVLDMAAGYNDAATAQAARARLAQPDVVSNEALMQSGLDALYKRHDPTAAAAAFRTVLERNPTHYGATYQLAAALDAAGSADEAQQVWERVLAMAQRYDDQSTVAAAQARLRH